MEVIWGYQVVHSCALEKKTLDDDGLFPLVYLNEYLCAVCFSEGKSFRNCITWMLELLIVRVVVEHFYVWTFCWKICFIKSFSSYALFSNWKPQPSERLKNYFRFCCSRFLSKTYTSPYEKLMDCNFTASRVYVANKR